MTTGIYKIENLLNGKVYIGQSVHIEIRWKQHCSPSSNSIIANAIQKYGKNNFTFQILEECDIVNLDDREAYYIHYYNSVIPNGYNIEERSKSSKTSYLKYDKDTFMNLVSDLEEEKLSILEIAEKYKIDVSVVYKINKGAIHKLDEKEYPLRQVKDFSLKHHFCIDCGEEIGKGAVRCLSCARKQQRRCERPNREQLKHLIRTETFVNIGKHFGVTDNSVRKWCVQYNLPKKKSEIKKYSDDEWQKI